MMLRGRTIAWLVGGAALVAIGAPDAQARPLATTITGDVIAARGRWTADHRNILTDAVVRTPAGDVDVIQLGGHVDGRTMMIVHGPAQLAPGQRVTLTVHPTTERVRSVSARPRWVVDDVAVLDPGTVAPYVRTTTNKAKTPTYWAKSCVEISRAREGTTAIATDAEAGVIASSIAAWNSATAGCGYLDLVDLGAVDSEVGNDGINLIKFRDTRWCRPAIDGEDEHCFSHQASGITTLLFVDDPDDDRDGELIDADIEMNGVDFAISINGSSESPEQCKADLANTLVHELGHLLGLGHTCLGPTDAPRTDGAGNPVPLCSETTDVTIVDATMYPFQACGETSKASLSADDAAAICEIYPKDDDPGVCEGPDELGGGCCDQGGGSRGAAPAFFLAAALLLFRRRGARA